MGKSKKTGKATQTPPTSPPTSPAKDPAPPPAAVPEVPPAKEAAPATAPASPAKEEKKPVEYECGAKGKYQDSTGPKEAKLGGSAIKDYGWADGKKRVSVYVDLEGIKDLSDDNFSVDFSSENARKVVLTINMGKEKRTLTLNGLTADVSDVKLELKKKAENQAQLRLVKKEEGAWYKLLESSSGGDGGGSDDEGGGAPGGGGGGMMGGMGGMMGGGGGMMGGMGGMMGGMGGMMGGGGLGGMDMESMMAGMGGGGDAPDMGGEGGDEELEQVD